MYGGVWRLGTEWDQDKISLHWHRHTWHPCHMRSKHLTVGLYFGSNQLHWLLLRDGNRFLRLKQGHPVCLSVFGDLIEGGIRRWQHFHGTHTPVINTVCSKQLAIGLAYGSSQISGPLVQDEKMFWGWSRAIHYVWHCFKLWYRVGPGYNITPLAQIHLSSMPCVLKTPDCCAGLWLQPASLTPPSGWE